jgi:probable addiction module antidote protein
MGPPPAGNGSPSGARASEVKYRKGGWIHNKIWGEGVTKEEPKVLLLALRRLAEARGGFTKVAKAAGIERESLYRALSARGNPRLSTLVAVVKAVGLKLTVEKSQPA